MLKKAFAYFPEPSGGMLEFPLAPNPNSSPPTIGTLLLMLLIRPDINAGPHPAITNGTDIISDRMSC